MALIEPTKGTDSRTTVGLAIVLMGMIVMMILPMPSAILDFGLAISFGVAILIFLLTLFVNRAAEFSSFSTMLLASLLLRLSLNVSSTKLIIGEGHTGPRAAGDVIYAFSSFVMGGSILIGLVVFLVLMIVNFMVITKGAARMAEVGARFALDAMPGKQLAIDSDLSAGAITHEEARARREREAQETSFYGSLDGASKFVKGDAVAGLLITLLNLVMGFVVGVFAQGMSAGDAFETYAILTVGDGLVTQIPAVIISVASGLLLARGGTVGTTDTAIFGQVLKYPAAIGAVGGLMFAFALFPGLPFLPFSILGSGLLVAAYILQQRQDLAPIAEAVEETTAEPEPRRLGDLLDLDDVHVEFAPDLVAMVLDPGTGLDGRIERMRNHVAESYGVILPEIRLTDSPELPQHTYAIRIQGVVQAEDILLPDALLALETGGAGPMPPGRKVEEPVYGAPARWIAPADREQAVLDGITTVAPAEVLATHLLEMVKRNFPRLLTLKAMRRLFAEMTSMSDQNRAEANRKLLEELVPDKVPVELALSVCRLLLEERVSIRNLPTILEAISEARSVHTAPEAICEHVRQRLGFQIIAGVRRSDGTIPVLNLAPAWEAEFTKGQMEGSGRGTDVALAPDIFQKLSTSIAETISALSERGIHPALVVSAPRRRFLASIVSANGLMVPVISFEELGFDARPAIVGEVPAPVIELSALNDQLRVLVLTYALVFCRVGALAIVLPPLVEGSLPARVRLGVGLVLAVIVYPLVAPGIDLPQGTAFFVLVLSESAVGLAIGLLLRLTATALQICGVIIAQSTSLAQVVGTPGLDPSPAISNVLIFSGIALAMMFDMHVRLAVSLAGTYDLVPVGAIMRAATLAEIGVGRISELFALAFRLAAPFTIAAFLYNLALGIANRAMPQLMVVLVGAPAIVGATLVLMAVGTPHMIELWMDVFGRVIDAPLGSV